MIDKIEVISETDFFFLTKYAILIQAYHSWKKSTKKHLLTLILRKRKENARKNIF